MLFKPKYDLTFVCVEGKGHFAVPILKELEKKYTIQYLYLKHKREYCHFKVKGKVIWSEWATKFAVKVSKKNWKNRKSFIRLHRFEIETDFMQKIKWKNINSLILVNSQYENQFKKNINSIVNTITIPNAIEISSFPFLKKKYGKNICALSVNFIFHKGYLNLIRTFKKIVDLDNEFKLNIIALKSEKSDEQRKILDQEIELLGLKNYINLIQRNKLDNLQNERTEISKLLSENDIIVSYSDFESFHYSFAEGMLIGLEGFYNMWHNPLCKEFWEDYGCNSEDDFVKSILDWSKLSNEDKLNKAKLNREYIINNYSSEVIAKKYEALLFSDN